MWKESVVKKCVFFSPAIDITVVTFDVDKGVFVGNSRIVLTKLTIRRGKKREIRKRRDAEFDTAYDGGFG